MNQNWISGTIELRADMNDGVSTTWVLRQTDGREIPLTSGMRMVLDGKSGTLWFTDGAVFMTADRKFSLYQYALKKPVKIDPDSVLFTGSIPTWNLNQTLTQRAN